jgi:hypothetical protein
MEFNSFLAFACDPKSSIATVERATLLNAVWPGLFDAAASALGRVSLGIMSKQ